LSIQWLSFWRNNHIPDHLATYVEEMNKAAAMTSGLFVNLHF
jgi:hypothetical protein